MSIHDEWDDEGHESAFTGEALQFWGAIAAIILLLAGLALFVWFLIVPEIRLRGELNAVLITAEDELSAAQLAQLDGPPRLRTELGRAEERIQTVAERFLDENGATTAVNRLYAYARATQVDIVSLQTEQGESTPGFAQRTFRVQVAGSLEALLDFLARFEESRLPGLLVRDVTIVPQQDEHRLTMNIVAYTSPFAGTFTVAASPPESLTAPEPTRQVNLNAEWRPTAQAAWAGGDWTAVVELFDQVLDDEPDNLEAREALYRAHLNQAYAALAAGEIEAARAGLTQAREIKPGGREAAEELAQLEADATLATSVQLNLQQEIEQARSQADWGEVIRVLRIINVIDPAYDPNQDALYAAYRNYGDQLMAQGNRIRGEQQHRMADSLRANGQPTPVSP